MIIEGIIINSLSTSQTLATNYVFPSVANSMKSTTVSAEPIIVVLSYQNMI